MRLHTELTALTTRLADNGYDKDSELSGYRSALEEIARYPSGTYGSAEIARVALSANGHDCIYNNDAMRYNQSMINTVETKPNIVAVAASLLDALKVLRRDHSMAQPHHEDLCSICKQADAAIAKAESGV